MSSKYAQNVDLKKMRGSRKGKSYASELEVGKADMLNSEDLKANCLEGPMGCINAYKYSFRIIDMPS